MNEFAAPDERPTVLDEDALDTVRAASRPLRLLALGTLLWTVLASLLFGLMAVATLTEPFITLLPPAAKWAMRTGAGLQATTGLAATVLCLRAARSASTVMEATEGERAMGKVRGVVYAYATWVPAASLASSILMVLGRGLAQAAIP